MKQIKDKGAQEEMVGFAMIIIIVAIVLLVLLGISLNRPKATTGVESYEVESFILAAMQQTSTCSVDSGASYLDVRGLIIECDNGQTCSDGQNTCSVLNSTIKDVLKDAWQVGADRPVKGYELNVTAKDRIMLTIKEGNATANFKGGLGDVPKRGVIYNVGFKVYY